MTEETMVDVGNPEEETDLSEEEIVEESEDSEESLEDITGEVEDEGQSTGDEPEKSQGTSEPGWFRTRWNKEVNKLSEQIRNELRNEYEAKFAPIQERLLEMDAQELLKSGKVKDIETARELVRYRNGQPTQPKQESPERNDKGQFVSKEKIAQEAATDARIKELQKQADKIHGKGGPDVIAEFKSNPKIKQKVISGEMDFYDVADYMKTQKKRSPAPVRSPNGASGSEKPNAIENMTKEQFAKLEKRISEGARVKLS